VGISGGKDSSTLLYLLNKYKYKYGIKLSAVLIDEGIKGYRDKTIIDAKRLCLQFDGKRIYAGGVNIKKH
jgi:tRNA(Ile)-lysidine synthase TilS/MesJ